MITGQRKAVPSWMEGIERAAERIREITRDHPLTELEVGTLAEYWDQCELARQADTNARQYMEYKTVVDWLASTSRISPKKHRELMELVTLKRRK